MYAALAAILGFWSLIQFISNYVFLKLEKRHAPNAYETKKICWKTARTHLVTAISMFLLALILIIVNR